MIKRLFLILSLVLLVLFFIPLDKIQAETKQDDFTIEYFFPEIPGDLSDNDSYDNYNFPDDGNNKDSSNMRDENDNHRRNHRIRKPINTKDFKSVPISKP